MSPFTVHEHAHDSPLLQKALHKSLPNSVDLTYRTQHPNRTPDAHILATFPPDGSEVPECWAAAYIDRSERPETELWIFSRGEVQSHSPSGFCTTCRIAVLSLMDYMSTMSVPPLRPTNMPTLDIAKQHEREFPETGPDAKYPVSFASHCRHLLDPNVITLGACHVDIVQICTEFGLVREEFPGKQARLDKFLFKISDLPETRKLPEGLRWGEMTEKDIDIVTAKIELPRSSKTLMTLKGVAVFDEKTNEAVAWAFLGLDGSLSSLETLPEYRGRGIAKAVTSKILGEWAGLAVDEKGSAWAHANVYERNVQSISVCRSVGGQPMWKTYWVRIDIGKAGHLATGK